MKQQNTKQNKKTKQTLKKKWLQIHTFPGRSVETRVMGKPPRHAGRDSQSLPSLYPRRMCGFNVSVRFHQTKPQEIDGFPFQGFSFIFVEKVIRKFKKYMCPYLTIVTQFRNTFRVAWDDETFGFGKKLINYPLLLPPQENRNRKLSRQDRENFLKCSL